MAAGDSVALKLVPLEDVDRVGQEMRRQAALAQDPAPPAAHAAASRSVADELVKLVGLRDSGILTEEEFNVQKAKLLD